MSRFRSLHLTVLFLVFAGPAVAPSHAENKDILQLQVEVQQLQESVARLQQTNDESFGMLKQLVQQLIEHQLAPAVGAHEFWAYGVVLVLRGCQE